MGADILFTLDYSSLSDRNYLARQSGADYLEHGLGGDVFATRSPLTLPITIMESRLSGEINDEKTAQLLARIEEQSTGFRDYGDGRFEYFLYPHYCPAGGKVVGAAQSNAFAMLSQSSPPGDDGYDFFAVDLCFYRPQYGPNPVVSVTYPPPPPQTHTIHIDLSAPIGFPAGAGEYFFELVIENIDGGALVASAVVEDLAVIDVSTIDVSAIVDDMVIALNNTLGAEGSITRLPDTAGQAVLKLEMSTEDDSRYVVGFGGVFYIYNTDTEEEWQPLPSFYVEISIPEDPDPIFDDPSSWGWFADLSAPPAHVIEGVPNLGWADITPPSLGPGENYNRDNSFGRGVVFSTATGDLLDAIYDGSKARYLINGEVGDGPWIAVWRVRYKPVDGGGFVTVYKRFINRDGTITVIPVQIWVPSSYQDQHDAWAALDSEGLRVHYSVRSEAVPTSPAVTTVTSPWAQLLADDTVQAGKVDRTRLIPLNNWLDG